MQFDHIIVLVIGSPLLDNHFHELCLIMNFYIRQEAYGGTLVGV